MTSKRLKEPRRTNMDVQKKWFKRVLSYLRVVTHLQLIGLLLMGAMMAATVWLAWPVIEFRLGQRGGW